MRVKLVFFVLSALLAAGFIFFFFPGHGGAGAQLAAEPAPDWQLPDLEGKTVKLSDFRGKVVVLNFWATYCPPCLDEIPEFIEVEKQYRDRGVVVVGASVDAIAPPEVAAFTKRLGMNYPIVMTSEAMAMQYDPEGYIPVTFIIDREGRVVYRHLAILKKGELEGELKKWL